jgi:hypothetical protein
MPSTHKKVIVRKMDRDSVSGYVSPTQFVNEGKLELLNTAGNVVAMELREIKGLSPLVPAPRGYGYACASKITRSSRG